MKKYNFSLLIMLAGVFLLFFILGPKNQRVDLQHHAEVSKVLAELKDHDVRLNEHMLMVRSGMLRNYDDMVTITNGLATLQQELVPIIEETNDNARVESKLMSEKLFKNLENKIASVERYKSDHSILRNSQSYLPVAVNRLREVLSLALKSRLNDLASDVYIFLITY